MNQLPAYMHRISSSNDAPDLRSSGLCPSVRPEDRTLARVAPGSSVHIVATVPDRDRERPPCHPAPNSTRNSRPGVRVVAASPLDRGFASLFLVRFVSQWPFDGFDK